VVNIIAYSTEAMAGRELLHTGFSDKVALLAIASKTIENPDNWAAIKFA